MSVPTADAALYRIYREALPKRRVLKTGRGKLWTFRCNPALIERCKAEAKRRDMPVSEWMESVLTDAMRGKK